MSGSRSGDEQGALWSQPWRACDRDVLGIGEISLDHVCVVEEMPRSGAGIQLLGYARRPGGQVATTVLACARLGLRAGIVGGVGGDDAAEVVLAPLREAGVDLSGVARVAGAETRLAIILVHRASGERTVLGHRDPRLALDPARIERERERILGARVLHLDARDPKAAMAAARIAREAGIPVVLDAERSWPGAEALVELADFPIVSRRFAEEWGETGSVRDGLRALASRGARLAVVTLGELGAIGSSSGRDFESPAFPVEARDTTGAGDAFHAGLIWSLLRGHDAERALRVANAVAAMSCEAPGAQGGLPTADAVGDFLATRRPQAWKEP